jgi:hypothetical protein
MKSISFARKENRSLNIRIGLENLLIDPKKKHGWISSIMK